MNDEAVREKLAAALLRADTGFSGMSYDAAAIALLPVVREIAAEELEWAAEEVRTNHGTASRSAKRIYRRADALTKPPDGPVR